MPTAGDSFIDALSPIEPGLGCLTTPCSYRHVEPAGIMGALGDPPLPLSAILAPHNACRQPYSSHSWLLVTCTLQEQIPRAA